MNIKELVFIVILALATTYGLEYLFFGKQKPCATQTDAVKSGQSFVAPASVQELKPLNREIDFIDTKRTAPAIITEVDTPQAHLEFSTDGAALERLEFKHVVGCQKMLLTTVFPSALTERDNKCFLVALQEKTPFFYDLVSKQETDSAIEVTYQTETDAATLRKKFTVYKATYKLDVTLTVIPKGTTAVEPRIFFPSPVMPEIEKTDVKSAIVNDEKGSISKLVRAKVGNQGWYATTFFGTDDRYFVHAMIGDPQQFAKRSYYKLAGQSDIFSVLEGAGVTKETTWTVSFYFGPKESSMMATVDPRLEQTLEYAGFFAPISKFLLKILLFFYKYLGNFGLAIIMLTLLIKLILLPFSLKSEQGMKERGEFQKKLQYIQQRYKHDPEQLAQERAELIRKHGMPGMSGCLPLLLQIPVFYALSRVLYSSIELYKAPFFGWITDLSSYDPYYVLPLLLMIAMLVQATTVEKSQRVSLIVMALVFGALTASFSAGLAIYILMQTVFGVVQTYLYRKFKAA